jgi:hypothetical protein
MTDTTNSYNHQFDNRNQQFQNSNQVNFTPIAPLVTWADKYGASTAYVELLGFPNSANYQRIEALDFIMIEDVWDNPRYCYFARIEEANLNLSLMGLSRENPTRIVTQERFLRGIPTPSTLGECVHLFKAKIITRILNGTKSSPRTRPNWNSPTRLATQQEIIDNLSLPEANPNYEIGVIA